MRCKDTRKKRKGVAKVKSFGSVQRNDKEQHKAAIAKGPISVALNSRLRSFRSYKSGIYNVSNCCNTVTHGVVAVGYGKNDDGKEYYLIKNSWGPGWGDKGYMKIAITEGAGMCGIHQWSQWVEAEEIAKNEDGDEEEEEEEMTINKYL